MAMDMRAFAAAECGIRQLQAHYCDAVWRLDFDAFGDCFTQDCEWRIDGAILKGRADIVAFNRELFTTRFRRLLLTLRTPVLDVQGRTASGRTYFSAQNLLSDGTPFAPIGVYHEHFIDEGDRWRFQWRLFETLYSGPPGWAGTFHDQPDYGAPPAMPPRDVATVSVVGVHRDVARDRAGQGGG